MYTRKHFNFVRTALMLFFALFVSSNAWADTPVGDKSVLQGLLDAGGTVKLEKDYAIDGYVVVQAGKTVILDLNGHTIDRGLKDVDAVADGYVIKVEKSGNTIGDLTITDTSDGGNGTITGGKNTGDGGGIYNAGRLTFNNGIISGNSGNHGGGIYNANSSYFYMNGGIIENNAYSNQGGGIHTAGVNALSITGGTIRGNSGGYYGGGIYVLTQPNKNATISNCSVTGNYATRSNLGYGGGVYYEGNNNATLKITNCTITGNNVLNGGKDYYGGSHKSGNTYYASHVIFERCTFTDNQSVGTNDANSTYKVVLADNADNSGMITSMNGLTPASVTLSGRTLTKNDSWNTLCLPFAVSTTSGPLSGDGVQAMTLNTAGSGLSGSVLTLNFTTATDIPAGTPFIIKWTSGDNLEDPVFTGVSITSTTPTGVTSEDGNVTFVGQYSPFTVAYANEIIFIGSKDAQTEKTKIGYAAQGKVLRSFRAHFDMSQTNAPIMNVVFNTEDGQTTAINTVNGSELKVNGEYYNLAGQRVAQPTKGLYIVNGKKMFVK